MIAQCYKVWQLFDTAYLEIQQRDTYRAMHPLRCLSFNISQTDAQARQT